MFYATSEALVENTFFYVYNMHNGDRIKGLFLIKEIVGTLFQTRKPEIQLGVLIMISNLKKCRETVKDISIVKCHCNSRMLCKNKAIHM